MVNLLFDSNYLFHKTLGVFAGYGSVDPSEVFSTLDERAAFIRKVSTDLCASLKSLPSGGKVVMCVDSRSWRKDIEIAGGGYKSNRVKDETVDWSIFFQMMTSFAEHLEKMGFIFSKVNGAEGDDLLYFWSRHFNTKGENCIVVSADKDLHQLVKNTKNGSWTAVWNNNSKNSVLYVPQLWKEHLETKQEVSIFDLGSSLDPSKEKLKEFASKVKVEEIYSRVVSIEKILSGDKGDAVPSVWVIEKNGRNHGITPKKVEAVLEYINESKWRGVTTRELLEDPEFTHYLAGYLLRLIGDIDSMDNRNRVLENLERNKKLVWLDKTVYPQDLVYDIQTDITRGDSLPRKSITADRIKLLEGTEWVTEGYVPKKFDPFGL